MEILDTEIKQDGLKNTGKCTYRLFSKTHYLKIESLHRIEKEEFCLESLISSMIINVNSRMDLRREFD